MWRAFGLAWFALISSTLPALGQGVSVEPAELELKDAFSGSQILVSSGQTDLTHAAKYSSENPDVAVAGSDGLVRPVADGSTFIVIEHSSGTYRLPVTVRGLKDARAVDFQSEVAPILSRYGCNSGGCHGKASGQNGFKLSLFGFDTVADYQAIVEESRGRRVFPSEAGRSLFVQKAVGAVPHGGGKRFELNSEAGRLLTSWIQSGARPASPESPRVVSISVRPAERTLTTGGQQQLAVIARYSDGQTRDVTRQADFASNLEVVAAVDSTGLVKSTGQTGEATIMARYMGRVAIFSAIVPHSAPLTDLPEFQPVNRIDEFAAAKWRKLGLRPSPVCSDSDFLRRVTLDLCGRLPTVDEARDFLAQNSPRKRAETIQKLLNSPDYPAFFAMRWGAILRNSNLAGSDDASYAFHAWLKDRIARNAPYDEFVRGILAAAGEWKDAPAINWYWQMRDDQLHQVTADTAQVFLGLRLQCARCHHHPYERWSQEDYYGLAGFFTRLGRKSFGQPPPYFSASNVTMGEPNPLTGRAAEPKYLDGEYAKFTPEQDPRHGLVDWMVQPDNPFLAKTLVNRMWGHFMGRGLVHEVDDMRETNPASNPELLNWLAQDFIEHRFDVRHVIQQIVSSRVYQLSSVPTEHNRSDQQNFARFYGRRLIAEVLHDAVDQAAGTRSQFGGVGATARAVDLPHEGFGSYFLDTFDRPKRVTGCECERSSGATLAQVLLLSNSDDIENKLASGEGRVARLITAQAATSQIVDELYLAAFSRQPTGEERKTAVEYIESESDRRKAVEDILWTLLNSREFMFNH